MKAVVRGSSRPGAHTVVLGCAKAARGQMAPLLEVLAAQEHHVELVSGVEESRQRWREAGQRHGTRAVYVACGGPGLSLAELSALREELLALGIPAGSIWAEAVDWSQLDRLVRDVDRMIAAAPVMVPAPPPLSSLRPSAASSVPPPPPPSSPVQRVAPMQVVGPREGTEGSIAPMLPPSPARLASVGPSREVGPLSLAPDPATRPREGARPMDTMNAIDPMDSVVARRGGKRRMALGLGALAVVGIVAAVLLASPGSTSAEDGPEPAAGTAAAPSKAAAAPSRAADEQTAAPSRAADETRPAPIATAAGQVAVRTPLPAELVAAVPAGADPIATDDDALVHAALMQRKIRALDILLVSPEATRKIKGRRTPRVLQTNWAGAQAHCEGLEIDGVGGWRLPTAGEFRTLGSSNMLERRIYWSATEGDAFGTDRVVWNNHKKRMAPAPSTWKGGRVLCVRFQHPERVSPS